MLDLSRNLLILALILSFLGCESKKEYDIAKDPMLLDLNIDISELNDELNTLNEEIAKIDKIYKDPNGDLDSEMRQSLRREINAGAEQKRILEQNLDYLKIRRKKRFKSLHFRKGKEDFGDTAKKEASDYLYQKKLNPMKKTWLERYRSAVEL